MRYTCNNPEPDHRVPHPGEFWRHIGDSNVYLCVADGPCATITPTHTSVSRSTHFFSIDLESGKIMHTLASDFHGIQILEEEQPVNFVLKDT